MKPKNQNFGENTLSLYFLGRTWLSCWNTNDSAKFGGYWSNKLLVKNTHIQIGIKFWKLNHLKVKTSLGAHSFHFYGPALGSFHDGLCS